MQLLSVESVTDASVFRMKYSKSQHAFEYEIMNVALEKKTATGLKKLRSPGLGDESANLNSITISTNK